MVASMPPLPIARFSVEQYHRMIESGAFTEDDQLELIDGWVIRRMAKGPGHEYTVGRLEELLRERLPSGWHVRNQAPITFADSEPEPDLAIVHGTRTDYRNRHPAAHEVALLIEVSDTTLATDRLKGRTYGRAGISEYWIVNLPDRCVEVYRGPGAAKQSGYVTCDVYGEGSLLTVLTTGMQLETLSVASFLP